ncbi:hypothetical protein T08_6133 [Trichinella sp. T8]|nr:hypothetical protein T08_6133 [Trichinella sp. T8]
MHSFRARLLLYFSYIEICRKIRVNTNNWHISFS